MTKIILIRHAHSVANHNGILAGRALGVALSPEGEEQARNLVKRLGASSIAHIRMSPMQRCSQTRDPWIADQKKRPSIDIDEDLSEVDYGAWTGKKLAVLSKHKLWKIVQNTPSQMYFPQGEGLAAMQARAMHALARALALKGTGPRILVSHGDVIKAIVASTLGAHLDHFQKIVIDPASVTILDFSGNDVRILLLNDSRAVVDEIINSRSHSKALVGGGAGLIKRKNT